ncbi:type IV secretion system protein [Rickettsiales bacterium]|nr:type IV secretion system protein [Rickettsiales bacterium]
MNSIASLSNSYADDTSTRPTQEAVTEDILYCSPMYLQIAALYVLKKSSLTFTAKIASAAAIMVAYAGYRTIIEDWAIDYQNGSYVVNHLDLNNDTINDYAKWVNLDAINNDAKIYSEYLGKNATELRLANVSKCQDIYDNAPVTITRTDPDNGFEYYSKDIESSDVVNLPGCRECTISDADANCGGDGNLHGFTYELYDQQYLCDGGVLIHLESTGDEVCVMKGKCERLNSTQAIDGFGDYLVCAYKMDELICSEAVSCSFTIFDKESGTEFDGDELANIASFFGNAIDYSAIDGRTAHGKDPTDPGIPAIITCQELVDSAAESTCNCTLEQAEDQHCAEGAYYPCSNDNITTVDTCSLCGDVSECIDDAGKFIENCQYQENQLCGYYPNEKYMAHCALEKEINIDASYELPEFVSKYCTGEATVDNGNMSIAGRLLRCVELSVQNMMYGAYEEADGREITGIYCSNDDSAVSLRSECEAGIFIQFQDRMVDVVRTLMALSISMIGIMILFGLIQDVKSILHYVLTFGLVFYFAVSDGWRDGYYNAAVTAGRTIGMIIGSNLNYQNIYGVTLSDGCDYYIDADGVASSDNNMAVFGNDGYEYPDNEAHYAVWDSYDCKMEKFFSNEGDGGFGSFGQIMTTAFPFGFVAGMISLMCLVVLIVLFLFFTVQFLTFALTAFFVLTLLVFISPVIIPLALLKNVQKARGIFETWLKTLIAYSFQPLIVWSIIAILSVVIDYGLYGEGKDVFDDASLTGETIATISNKCKSVFLPCLYHKLDIGYYSISFANSLKAMFSGNVDMVLASDSGLAYLRIVFFIGPLFFIAVSAMQILAGQIFDAAENADISKKVMSAIKGSFVAGGQAGLAAGMRAKNTASSIYQRARYGSK